MGERDDLDAWDSDVPFAERAWHRCPSCRHDEGRGVNGTPPWHICTIRVALAYETDQGRNCVQYAPLPWAKRPAQPKDPRP